MGRIWNLRTTRWVLVLLVASCSKVALAQSEPPQQPESQEPETRQSRFEIQEARIDASLSLERGRIEAGEPKWQLRVRHTGADEPLSSVPAPQWVGRTHYGFDIEIGRLDDTHDVVLFSATPGVSGEPPPSAPEFKAAWVVHHEREGKDRWRHAASTQYSELDGGSRILMRERDGESELVRFNPDAADRFCGVLDDDTFTYERFVIDQNRFVTEFDFDTLARSAVPLDSQLGDKDFTPPMLQGWFQWFIASTDARTPDEDESLIRPLELGDFRLELGWSEGAEGLGRGEFVTAQVNDAVPMTSVRVFPGDAASKDRYRSSGKPTKLLIALENGARYTFDVPTADYETMVENHGIRVTLPEPQPTNCMTMVILEAARGVPTGDVPESKAEAVTIAEATPYSTLHGKDADETADNIVAFVASSDEPRRRERVSELGLTIGEPLVTAVLRKMREGTPEERRRVIPLLASIPSQEAVPLLAEYLEHFGPGDQEYRAVKRALAAHHRNSADALVTYIESMEDVTSRKYVDMIRLLGRVGAPGDIAVLLDDLGQGDNRVRNERVRAAAKAGVDLVPELLAVAAREPNSRESHDAFKALNLIGRRAHYDDHGTLPKPDLYLDTLRQTEARRTLMRGLRVAKYFRTEGYVALVAETYAEYPDPLIRREAIGALGRYPSARARRLILDAMEDRSPDVRIAAVETLGEREDVGMTLESLEAYIGEERWRAGLQQAFRTLARIDEQATSDIFARLLEERPNSDAALIALQALNREDRALDGADIVRALESNVSRAQTRLELVDNLGVDKSDVGRNWLTKHATSTLEADPEDPRAARDVRRTRRHAILALGRRRGEQGQATLLELARNSDDEDVREVAIRALGFYASPDLLETLEQWRRRAEPGLREKLDETINMVDRRISVDEAEEEVIDAMDDVDDNPDGGSPENSGEDSR
jgi:HEAT repeat protein